MTTNVHDMDVLLACVNSYCQWADAKINMAKRHYQTSDQAHVPPSADSLVGAGCQYPNFQVLCGHCELGLVGNRQTRKSVDACLQESMESQLWLARRDIVGGT